MDPIVFLPLNLKEEQLEEFQADDEQEFKNFAAFHQSEVDQRCRMCADKYENMKQIFSMEAMELNLSYKMEKYVNIKVSEEDRLPLQVCASCEAKLEMSVALVESCADAQTFLNNLLAPPNTEDLDSSPASPEMLADNFSDTSEDAFPEPLENLPITSEPIEKHIEELINIGKVTLTKPDAFVCKECSVTCIDKEDLENHYYNEHINLLCKEGCYLIFNSSTELNKHHKQVHAPKVSFLNATIQNKCKKVVHNVYSDNERKENLESQNEIQLVNRSHKKELVQKKIYEFKCTICDKVYNRKCRLRYHILKHNGLNRRECPVCHKWVDIKTLRNHKETHNPKKFVCDFCQRQFSIKRYIDQHIRKVHMKEWFYECNICNKKYKNETSIKKHVKNHKNISLTMESKYYIKKSNFQCKICNRYSANELHFKDHLMKHKREKNNDAKNSVINPPSFQCDMCAKMYTTKPALDFHIRGFHRGEKPLQCQYCPKRFLHKQAFTEHEMNHEGNFPFKCHLCPKSYVRHSKLQIHIQRGHLNLRPFKCTYCGKAFHTSDKLGIHTRTHTGERPFICKVCGRGFTQKHDMQKHEVSHSNGVLYNCKNCNFGSNRLKDLTEHICNETVQSLVKRSVTVALSSII